MVLSLLQGAKIRIIHANSNIFIKKIHFSLVGQENPLSLPQLIENRTLGKATTLHKFKKDISKMGLVYSILPSRIQDIRSSR